MNVAYINQWSTTIQSINKTDIIIIELFYFVYIELRTLHMGKCINHSPAITLYVSSQSLLPGQVATQSQFLSGVQLVWILEFSFS